VCPVATGTLFAKLAQGFAELGELGLVDGPRPRLYGAQPGGYPPLADAWAEDRPPSGMQPDTTVHSLAVADPVFGDLAVGAARMSGGGIHAVPESRIGAGTALLAESTGIFADSAGGVAVETLLELIRSGVIREGERVVLIVTGTGLKPYRYDPPARPLEIDATVDGLLAALGLFETH
jgi:threonine synthase